MSYSVALMDDVRRKISGWSLPSDVIREVLKGLDDLAVNSSRRLIRVGPPEDVLQFDLVVSEIGTRTRDHLFTFSVRYAADEETLLVFDCEYLFEDRPDS